jgi:hypothetical protein
MSDSLSRIATPPSLPPRPPPAAHSNRDAASARSYSPPSTSSLVDSPYPNDFDRVLDDDASTAQGGNGINGEISVDPPQTGTSLAEH